MNRLSPHFELVDYPRAVQNFWYQSPFSITDMTFEQLRELALALPEVYERLCYGTPAFYVGKKLIARMLEDGERVVINHSELYRHALVNTNPEVFSIPPHYQKVAMIVIKLEAITHAHRIVAHGRARAINAKMTPINRVAKMCASNMNV